MSLESKPGEYTTGEIIALVAPLLGAEPADLIGYVIIGATANGGPEMITASNAGRHTTISMLLHAADRIAGSLDDPDGPAGE
jgi:hypothetical protein